MALYPDADHNNPPFVVEDTLGDIKAINDKVAAGVEQEPNTAFVDFTLPVGEEIFQTKNKGHPNCRGDRIMASRVLEVLYEKKVIARTLDIPAGEEAERCLLAKSCSSISDRRCCQSAARCRVSAGGQCVAYGPGE